MRLYKQNPLPQLLLLALVFLPIISKANANVYKLSHYERKIVATCLILEASSEGVEGMQAVLNVIYNRSQHKLDRIVGVVIKPKQFSCYNSITGKQKPNFSPLIRRALRDPLFNEAYQLVLRLEQNALMDITGGADHYHVASMPITPYWAATMSPTTTIGKHVFYSSNPET